MPSAFAGLMAIVAAAHSKLVLIVDAPGFSDEAVIFLAAMALRHRSLLDAEISAWPFE